ncbi:MAG: NAD(P)H-dependent glycerol-3-phosphate dehydrogenase [Patescibacteria group bacterium]
MAHIKRMRVAIIGAGDIGQAIATLVDPSVAQVDLWDVEPGKVPNQRPLDELVSKARIVFFCVPSWVLREAVTPVLPHLKSSALVVSISKGIESTTGKTMDAFWPEVLPEKQPFALLLGPMLAKEICDGLGAAAVVATKRASSYTLLRTLFAPSLRLEQTRDVRGVALVSVLKNVYALAMGLADGLGWGGNRKGWLASRAVQEMEQIVHDLGSKRSVVFGPAGAGDLLATAYSPYSRNRSTGEELIEKKVCERKSEGLVSVEPLMTLLQKKEDTYPLLALVARVIRQSCDARDAFEAYFHA